MPQKNLSIGAIRQNFRQGDFSRGEVYFQNGMLESFTIENEGPSHVLLHATAHGSQDNIYHQQIRLIWRGHNIHIHGDCSCPVSHNCKHVAAACLSYQQQLTQPKRQSNAIQWLEAFIQAGQPAPPPDPKSDLIHYMIQPSSYSGELTIQIIRTRPLKRGGGFVKGKELNIDDDRYHPQLLHAIDKEIFPLLRACPGKGYYSQPYLTGEIGFLVIRRMLDSGRCYWRDNSDPPLRTLEPQTLQLTWQRDDENNATLQYQVEGGGVPLLTTPPLYLNLQEGGIGMLEDAPYTPEQLKKLMESVTIPTAQVRDFSQKLAATLDSPLSPPQEIQCKKIETAPQPHIRLCGEQHNGHTLHSIRLNFLYQEHKVAAYPENPVITLHQGEQLIQIHRDLEQEHQAFNQLCELGFDGFIQEDDNGLYFLSISEDGLSGSLQHWQNFLEQERPKLLQQGWIVEQDDSFKMRFLHADESWDVEIEEEHDWFDLRFDLNIAGQKRPLLPLIASALEHYDTQHLPDTLTVEMEPNQYLTLPSKPLKPIINTLYELYDSDSVQSDGSLRLSRFDAARLEQLSQQSEAPLQWLGGEPLRELGKKLNNFKGIQDIPKPKALNAELREYQQQGLNWLQFLREYQFNGILADDMGLGKTVQTLAHLQREKQCRRLTQPCLIIAPTSLVSNWRREAEKFTPKLKVLVLHGPNRQQHFAEIGQHDLIITTFPLLVRDIKILQLHFYHYLILDEAQVIKNPKAKAAQLVRHLNSNHRLCLTGTPMENHLGELWALFDFLMPGFLGSAKQFKQLFRNPIEQYGDEDRQQQLNQRVSPFMLRRTKTEVAHELPKKTEIIRSVALESKQAALYESIRIAMEKKVQQAIASKGLARSHITILDALLKLRQCCCDPQLLKLKQAASVRDSAKLEMLMELLPEMVEEGRRILLFSQFTQMLGIIETRLQEADIRYCKLTGQTRKRDEVIQQFRNGQADVFLISLKAGGVGLNLTEADTVIHYDPWWNPAAENQATDRAHRIGQDKAVFVYKLITENTLEEKILAMQAKKQALADGVYGKEKAATQDLFNSETLQALLAPLD